MRALVDSESNILGRFISYRVGPLRSLRRWLIARGIGYHSFEGSLDDLWIAAAKHIPWFSSTLPVDELDMALGTWDEWQTLRGQLQEDDEVHPFAINVDTLAMKLGYVVFRQGRPIGGILVHVS